MNANELQQRNAIAKSAQSVINPIDRQNAAQIAETLADQAIRWWNETVLKFGTDDPFDLGEAIARDYVTRNR